MEEPLDYTRAAAMMDAAFGERKRYVPLGCDPNNMGYGLWPRPLNPEGATMMAMGNGSIAAPFEFSKFKLDERPLFWANRLGISGILLMIAGAILGPTCHMPLVGWTMANLGAVLWIAFAFLAHKGVKHVNKGSDEHARYVAGTALGAYMMFMYAVCMAAAITHSFGH